MLFSILFPAILFGIGFINILCLCSTPSNKFFSWLRSIFVVTIPSAKPEVFPAVAAPTTDPGRRKEELKRVFATFDKNGDGFITEQELVESLRNLNMSVTEKEAAEMVARVDANGDGLVDLDEFCVLCESMIMMRRSSDGGDGGDHDHQVRADDLDGGGEGELKEAFDVFDKDKDGLISVEELGHVLRSLGLNEGRRVEDCKAMIRKVDEDGDGMVNFNEFKRMMKPGTTTTTTTLLPVF